MSVKRNVTVPLGSSPTGRSLCCAARPGTVERLLRDRGAKRLQERSLELAADGPRVLLEDGSECTGPAPQLDRRLGTAPACFRNSQPDERAADHVPDSGLFSHRPNPLERRNRSLPAAGLEVEVAAELQNPRELPPVAMLLA